MKPPPRLLDDPALAPELRADLERTAVTPHAYDAAAGLAALHAAIGALQASGASSVAAAAAPTGAQASGAGAASTGAVADGATAAAAGAKAAWLASTGGKLALAATGAAVIAAGAIVWPRAATERATLRPPAALPSRAPVAPAPGSEPAGGDGSADAALRREIAELGRIKALLESDPGQAYRLAEAGHREHGSGMLRHEREGLAVLALWNLGRHDEATERARAFLARYPASPLGPEIERRLQAVQRAGAPESR